MFNFTLLPNFTRRVRFASNSLLFTIVLLTAFGAVAQTSPKTAPISTILDADGSVKPNMSGSFDPSGYRLEFETDGKPRFTTAESTVLGGNCNDGWEGGFSVNG